MQPNINFCFLPLYWSHILLHQWKPIFSISAKLSVLLERQDDKLHVLPLLFLAQLCHLRSLLVEKCMCQTAFTVSIIIAEQLKEWKVVWFVGLRWQESQKNRTLVYVIFLIPVTYTAHWLMNIENKTVTMWIDRWVYCECIFISQLIQLLTAVISDTLSSVLWIDLKVDLFSINRLLRNWSIKVYSLYWVSI